MVNIETPIPASANACEIEITPIFHYDFSQFMGWAMISNSFHTAIMGVLFLEGRRKLKIEFNKIEER